MRLSGIIFLLLVSCSLKSPIEHQIEKAIETNIPNTFDYSDKKYPYLWLTDFSIEHSLINRISLPSNFKRVSLHENSFADWLRHIPLKPGNPNVQLYNGSLKNRQDVHAAVLDIDVGTKDLQQCADAVMRLRAEYLLSQNEIDKIAFTFTSGDLCSYKKWQEGFRPHINVNNVQFIKTKTENTSYAEFKNYMNTIFTYCGTYSLNQELKTKNDLTAIMPGDVFIIGGFPGHAVIVMDVAKNENTSETIFLLAQSYMPAQEIHLMKNFTNPSLSPWFSANFEVDLNTPECTFQKNHFKQF